MISKFIERLLAEILADIASEPILIVNGRAWKVTSFEIKHLSTEDRIVSYASAQGVPYNGHRS